MSRYGIRLCGENLYHHIYAWGNDRHPIFKALHHFQTYLNLLEELSKKFKIDVIAYALMEWHVHLFIFDLLNKVSKFMEEFHGKYAVFFNKDTGRVGHVFGERYNNKIVQPNEYALWLSCYIHRQPVAAGLVSDPKDYPWTSYRQYIGLEPIKFIKPKIILEQFGDYEDRDKVVEYYEDFVLNGEKDIRDWEDFKSPIVGDFNFIKETGKRLKIKIEPPQNDKKEEILKSIAGRMNVSVDSLLNPVGLEQRRIRHKAINLLSKECGLKIYEIARILKVSRLTVMRNID